MLLVFALLACLVSGQAISADAVLTVAKRTYGGVIRNGGQVRVVLSAGNSLVPAIVIVPRNVASNTDSQRRFKVHVHYHGMASVAELPNKASYLVRRILQAENTVFILPHSSTAALIPKWDCAVNTALLVRDVTRDLIMSVDRITVSAHSYARFALTNLTWNNGLFADRLDVEDAFYSTQPDAPVAVAEWWRNNPNAEVRVLLTTRSMSQASIIISQAPSLKPAIVDMSRLNDHWDAEIKPWP